VFVVANLESWRRAAAVLFERESLQRDHPPSRGAGQIAPTIPARRSGGGGFGTDFDCDGGLIPDIVPQAMSAKWSKGTSGPAGDEHHNLIPVLSHALRGEGFAYVIKGAAIGREPHNGPQHGEILNDGSVYTLNCTETHAVAWTPEISNSLTARQGKEPAPDPTEGAPLMPFTAHALRGEGFDASEDGTGRGTPLVPVSYRTSGNCGAWETGDKTDALTTATDPDHHVLAFSSKDYGADAAIDIAPTMRAMGHAGSHANAGGQLAVATLAIRGSGDESNLEYRTDGTANALLTPNGGRAGIGVGAIQYGTAVRRLTPRECERLQGFPDDWTAITHRNKPAADGPRYKALGNSMAVPVLRWIGERIMWVSDQVGGG
jgi:DNA (cytosine-5)-methyltransferase 1